jgi:hypothetical protein
MAGKISHIVAIDFLVRRTIFIGTPAFLRRCSNLAWQLQC